MSVIRSAGLRGFRATVEELGGDPGRYAAAAGLPIEALDADDLLVSDVAVAETHETAAQELDRPDLGLRIAARQDLGMLGPLALAIQNSPTVSDALDCTSRYLFVHARSLTLSLEPDPYGTRGVGALRYGLDPGLPAPVQGTDLGLGFLHRAIQSLVGVGRPAAVLRVPLSLADQPLAGGTRTFAGWPSPSWPNVLPVSGPTSRRGSEVRCSSRWAPRRWRSGRWPGSWPSTHAPCSVGSRRRARRSAISSMTYVDRRRGATSPPPTCR